MAVEIPHFVNSRGDDSYTESRYGVLPKISNSLTMKQLAHHFLLKTQRCVEHPRMYDLKHGQQLEFTTSEQGELFIR